MTLKEFKIQAALGTLDVLKILDEHDLSQLPAEVINALAQLYLIMLKAAPYFYDWVETETRAHIYTKLHETGHVDKEILEEIHMLTPPFRDFRDSL